LRKLMMKICGLLRGFRISTQNWDIKEILNSYLNVIKINRKRQRVMQIGILPHSRSVNYQNW
jgi:hypothetical protein